MNILRSRNLGDVSLTEENAKYSNKDNTLILTDTEDKKTTDEYVKSANKGSTFKPNDKAKLENEDRLSKKTMKRFPQALIIGAKKSGTSK